MEENSKLRSIGRLGELAKPAALLIAAAYAAGIMIVNGYLASLGLVDFTIVRPQAVLSGLWFLLFFGVAMVADDSISYALSMREITSGQRIVNVVFAFGGAYVFYSITFGLCHLGRHVTLTHLFLMPIAMFISAGAAVTEAENAAKEWRRRRSDKIPGPTSAFFFLSHCLISAGTVVLFAGLFITQYYRLVPLEYGGGMPRAVQIAVSDKEASVLNGISISTTNNILDGPIELVHEGTGDIAILTKSGTVIILPRRETLAIRTLK